jgi:hypothetical protein
MPHLLTSGPFRIVFEHLRDFSTWKFSKWIPSIVPTLFSYYTRSHSTPNCMCLWSDSPLSHDQTFRWSSSHYNAGSIISTHKSHFMSLIPWNLCNTLFPTRIWSYNKRWLWNSNPQHQIHLQINVKTCHISKTYCSMWEHHITHPLCLCILSIWVSFVL